MRGPWPFVLGLVALLVAALIWTLSVGGVDRARINPVTERDARTPEQGPVALAEDDPVDAGSVRVAASEPVPAVADELDAPRWRDLVRPVDHGTGAVLDGGVIRLAMRDGRLVERGLDERVRVGELLDGGIGSLDTEGHCPRFFRVSELRDRAARWEPRNDGAPDRESDALRPEQTDLRLHPSGRVAIDFDGPVDPDALREARIALGSSFDAVELDPRLSRARSEEWGSIDQLLDLQSTAQRVLDPDARGVDRPALVDVLLRSSSVDELFDLEGPPLVAGLLRRRVEPVGASATWVDELPVGLPTFAMVVVDAYVSLSVDGGTTWNDHVSQGFTVHPLLEPVVFLRFATAGRIVGALPSEASDAMYELFELDRSTGAVRTSNRRSGSIVGGPGFTIGDVRPGSYAVRVEWSEPGGVYGNARQTFDLPAGATHDLGLLNSGDGELVVAPRVEVNGVDDPTRRGGALDEVDWAITLAQADDEVGGPTWIKVFTPSSFEPFTVRGLPPGRYHVTMFEPAYEDPTDSTLQPAGWRYDAFVDVAGVQRIEPVLELRSSGAVRVVVESDASLPDLELELRGVALGPGSSWERVTLAPSTIAPQQSAWSAVFSGTLPAGVWTVTITAAPARGAASTEHSDAERCGWVGRTTFTVEPGVERDVPVQLERAAVVRGRVRDYNGDALDWGTYVSLVVDGDRTRAHAELWGAWGDAQDAELAFHALLPNTTYRVEASGRTFVTGGPGSVTRLEE